MEKHTAGDTSQAVSQLDIELVPEVISPMDHKAYLSPKETRKIVTPYAFFVADDLLGTPLAGPFRRGFGLLIDLFFITLLTQVSGLVLAAVAAWTFFRAGNRLNTIKRYNAARIILRLLVAVLLFVVVMGIFNEINEDTDISIGVEDDLGFVSNDGDNTVDGIVLVALTAKYLLDTKAMKQQVALGECEPAYYCVKTLGEELVQDVIDIGLDRDTTDDALKGYLGSVSESLSEDQQVTLTHHLQQLVGLKRSQKNSPELGTSELGTSELGTPEQETPKLGTSELELSDHEPPEQQPSDLTTIQPDDNDPDDPKKPAESNGLVSWFDNLVEELGLGFGWAALYFSIFTAWWKGQTPGKKLMGMKVIKLDNTPLNLWESFGRYGGYAAGLATGLTGFLQVFWDPNRQAIQDKISETLVIDLRKPKLPFVKERVE